MKLKIEEVFSGYTWYIFVVFRIFSQKMVGRFQKKIGFPIKAVFMWETLEGIQDMNK